MTWYASVRKRWSSALGVGLLVAMMVAFLTYSLSGSTRTLYLPGPTTDGHYQIELACEACHAEAFGDREALQKSCVRCHAAELKEAEDSHPETKFTDPRNASRVALLDARYCVTCHREHRPELTASMGLSLPKDYCYRCHQDIGDERPSHRDLSFDTCQNAGCHNFHDNRALYEDFLVKHLDEPALSSSPENPVLTSAAKALVEPIDPSVRLTDAPADLRLNGQELSAFLGSAHARAGKSCASCHRDKEQNWSEKVPGERCRECHEAERDGYLSGRHGMREASGLPPMRVADARRPMREQARGRSLGCTSCHGAHSFDTRYAAVDACLGCHADEHSRSYPQSKHAQLFRDDLSGRRGVSCATCHLPRVEARGAVRVTHNQNETLRPNEKMVRSVCANCHGVEFSLAALSDPELIANNFYSRPTRRVESLAWVRERPQ